MQVWNRSRSLFIFEIWSFHREKIWKSENETWLLRERDLWERERWGDCERENVRGLGSWEKGESDHLRRECPHCNAIGDIRTSYSFLLNEFHKCPQVPLSKEKLFSKSASKNKMRSHVDSLINYIHSLPRCIYGTPCACSHVSCLTKW